MSFSCRICSGFRLAPLNDLFIDSESRIATKIDEGLHEGGRAMHASVCTEIARGLPA